MEKNYRLEKEYTITYDLFREAYLAFQKKKVYPRSYLFMGLFLLIAVIYIAAAVKDPSNRLTYILVFLSLALAVREWYNPRKVRRLIVDTVRDMGDMTYKICIDDEEIEISTIEDEYVENSEEEKENSEESDSYTDDMGYPDEDIPPENTKIPINEDITADEYENFFLIYVQKKIFYIIPKENWSEAEMEIVRELSVKAK